LALKFSDLLAGRKEGILLQDLPIFQNLRSPLGGEFPQLARRACLRLLSRARFRQSNHRPPNNQMPGLPTAY
jgi:hypothetical protein